LILGGITLSSWPTRARFFELNAGGGERGSHTEVARIERQDRAVGGACLSACCDQARQARVAAPCRVIVVLASNHVDSARNPNIPGKPSSRRSAISPITPRCLRMAAENPNNSPLGLCGDDLHPGLSCEASSAIYGFGRHLYATPTSENLETRTTVYRHGARVM
jgi:hypothetical protein